jgi:hypothetical protein
LIVAAVPEAHAVNAVLPPVPSSVSVTVPHDTLLEQAASAVETDNVDWH